MLTVRTAQALLPKIGDKRMERPTIDETTGYVIAKEPRKCVVVYVNAEHLWYTVKFENGIRESYKIPRVNPVGGSLYVGEG